MQICGLNKTTLLDYPEHVAATVFLGGCNFRCPFCHNSDLVLRPDSLQLIPKEEFFSFLKKRTHILTGVCVSGGEPTLYKELPDFIKIIKDMGFLVKLDTNGSNPAVIEHLLKENLLDYIAMDIKGEKEKYGEIVGFTPRNNTKIQDFQIGLIEAAVEIIRNSGILYEFRTTVIKEFHTKESFEKIGLWLHGSDNYFLQNFENSPNVILAGFHSYEKEELLEFSKVLTPHFKKVGIRGI
ncbi:MAG: anaerobic ribonucleoside-triphosphate reductase activating protein [Lachnospiraceae bacterium]|nr:anaerobic ribonucleoside-triphosphate reductase activating protein [Lachnospiraceae bacterium]